MIHCQRELFSLPEGARYLNCAFMSPLLHTVENAGIQGMKGKKTPFMVKVEDFFEPVERLREAFSNIINCPDPGQVVIIPSVSYGMANIAKNMDIPENAEIVIAGEQFPSNTYPWYRFAEEQHAAIKIIQPPDTFTGRGNTWNQQILDAINPNTALVSLSHCHWADGTLFDLKTIRVKTREAGAALIIDGTQSVGALPFDVQDIDPDALVCAGYKWLMGPYSIGLAYYGERFNNGTPIEENWINRINSEDFAGLVDYEDRYQKGALRYEVGEHSNFILVPMMLAALKQIQTWGIPSIQEYCRDISQAAIYRLREAGFWIEDENFRGSHLFGIRLPGGVDINLIKKELESRKVYVSVRGSSIRVAPHLYNTKEDFEILSEVLLNSVLNSKT
ncbi:MAG: aminotransferase class V-fold PLP-dependent enzyme [Bacteroidetes bacterium]|nr:aminotransferase class V-fold PLP-dependent enzyme [Bacteroidota bacterium]